VAIPCPDCGDLRNKVADVRARKLDNAIKRRRECLNCGRRWTTMEVTISEATAFMSKDRAVDALNQIQSLLLGCLGPDGRFDQ
jgi:transcriptional repressor NrdR